MSINEATASRMRLLLLATHSKPRLEELKRQVRRWQTKGSMGQDAINRAIVRAIDEVQERMDTLLKV